MSDYFEGKGLIVGLGSIGKTHLRVISELVDEITIVDINEEVQEFLDKKSFTCKTKYYNSIGSIPKSNNYNLIVISNWGPDHFLTFKKLLKMNAKNFVMEKPLVDSLSELEEITKLIKKYDLNLYSHMQLRYTSFKNDVFFASNNLNFGKPIKIVVFGGSKCIATVGIHFLDLAIEIFGQEPLSVMSNLSNSSINPRNHKLKFLEGVSVWNFSDNRDLTIVFSNESHISETIAIVHEFGRIEISGEKINYFGFHPGLNINDIPIPRTLNADHLHESGIAFAPENGIEATEVMYRKILNQEKKGFNEDGISATFWMLGSLVAAQLRKTLSRVEIESLPKSISEEKFFIS